MLLWYILNTKIQPQIDQAFIESIISVPTNDNADILIHVARRYTYFQNVGSENNTPLQIL
jgi:hypothetical protein